MVRVGFDFLGFFEGIGWDSGKGTGKGVGEGVWVDGVWVDKCRG